MPDPVIPSTGDLSTATYEQILFAVTGLGSDLHAVLDGAAGIGESPKTWFNFTPPGSAANSISYHAWDKYYYGVDHNQAAYQAWNQATNTIESISHQIWAGKAGLMDVQLLRDAKTVTDTYLTFLNNSLTTANQWVSSLDSEDSAFKGKAAFAIQVNMKRLAFTFNDLHDQIVEDRNPSTPNGLNEAAEALQTFGRNMATIWWDSRNFLFNEPANTANAIVANVDAHIQHQGLDVKTKDMQSWGMPEYLLDTFGDDRAKAEQYIRDSMALYNTNRVAPKPPAGMPEVDGDLTTKGLWDGINTAISTYIRTELTKMDEKARAELVKLEAAYKRAGRSLGDLKTNQPPSIGSPPPNGGGGGGGGGANPPPPPNLPPPPTIPPPNGTGSGGGGGGANGGGGGAGLPDLGGGGGANGGGGAGQLDPKELFQRLADGGPNGGGVGGPSGIGDLPGANGSGGGTGFPGVFPGGVPLPGASAAELRRRLANGGGSAGNLPGGLGGPGAGLDPDDGWAPGDLEPATTLSPQLGGGAAGGTNFGPGSTPGTLPGLDPNALDAANGGAGQPGGLDSWGAAGGGAGLGADGGFGAGAGAGAGAGGPFGTGSTDGWSDWSGSGSENGGPAGAPGVGGEHQDQRGGMPFFPPMMGGMGGLGGNRGEEKERERTTWLSEDEKVWGTDTEIGIGVIGRPDSGELEVDEPLVSTHVHLRSNAPRTPGRTSTPATEQTAVSASNQPA